MSRPSPGPLPRKNCLCAISVAAMFAIATTAVGCGDSSTQKTTAQTAQTTTTAHTTTTTPAATATSARLPTTVPPKPRRTPAVIKPAIVWDPIPFGPERKAQMVAYVHRHYGSFMRPTWQLIDPHVIVIHYTVTPDFQSTYNTFAADKPDSELHELPNICAHFVIDRNGVIHQLVLLGVMCRHTVGLNWTAIGIEHVGHSDQQVLDNPRQMTASVELVRWLRCRFHISVKNVIGHNESLTSPYHREDVPALRSQTHSDFNRADMQRYRVRLGDAGSC